MAAPGARALPQVGVTLPMFTADPADTFAALDQAHRLGYAGGFVFDHLWPLGGERSRPALECWTMLAALATRAGRLVTPGRAFALGTLVTRASLRPPALLARMAATLGQAAGAPLVLGVGGGDERSAAENAAFGLPVADGPARLAQVERALVALRGPHAGRPGPTLWAGGLGRGMRALAGRVADAWNAWGVDPDELAGGLADVRAAAEAAGRDPAGVTGTWGGQVLLDADAELAGRRLADWGTARSPDEVRRTLAGDPWAVADQLADLHAAGASFCVVAPVGGDRAAALALLAEALELPGRARD